MNVCMKKYLVDYGDDVIRLMSKIERKIKPAIEATPLERQNVSWTSMVRNVEKTIQRDKGPKRIKAIIGECAEKIINKIKQDRSIKEPGYYLVREFLGREYESDFKEPLKKKFSGKDWVDRLEESLSTKVEEENKSYYAKQIINKKSAKKLRKKPRSRKPKLDLDEEIGVK